MRDLSCLTKKEQKAIAKWLHNKDHGCWVKYDSTFEPIEDLMMCCNRTCGVVFPECNLHNTTYTQCPCAQLGEAYVRKELGGLPHD